MRRVVRPLAVFVIATAVGVGVGLRAAMIGGASDSSAGNLFPADYDLAELELTRATLYHVDQSYVDPSRVDWDNLVSAGLDAVEQMVPSVLFTRPDPSLRASGKGSLAVDIGDFHTVLDLPPVRDREGAELVLEEVVGLLADHLVASDLPPAAPGTGGAPMARVEYALINGILSTLDPHSILLPPEAAHEMDLDNQGEFGGLGITIVLDEEFRQLAIECPIPGTPAAEAGLQAGDRVTRIDGESTVNLSLDDAILRLRGPEGAVVHLTVARKGVEEPISIDVKRALIDSDPVEFAMLEGNVGWIRIQSFHEKVATSVADALASLHREAGGDLQGLVLDLRGNPGGFLTQAVRVADLFLTQGDIVSTVDGAGRQVEPPDVATRPAEPEYPIAVLVDASSASASEILAGALRYNERAVIVGERSFGKGSVQNLQTLADDSKLKLTISRYLTPGERSIQGVGIPADVELEPVVFQEGGGIHMFHRESVRREADLDAALESSGFEADEPAYRLRYVAPEAAPWCASGPDPRTDRELAFSRLLLVSAGRGWRRPDVLTATSRVVANQQRSFGNELLAAFQERGIDWGDGPAAVPATVSPVEVSLAVGEAGPGEGGAGEAGAGVLQAGHTQPVTVTVTNTTTLPLYRVAVVATGIPVLDGEEFFFGHLAPGERRSYTTPIEVPDGEPSERSLVALSVRDAGAEPLTVVELPVEVHGHPLPDLSWTLTPSESGGDGTLDAGDELRLQVTLVNHGGDAVAPFVRLRNHSGGQLELENARFEPGPLAHGATVTGTLTAHITELRTPGPVALELEVGDEQAYDRGVVMRAARYDWYQQRTDLALTVGQPLPGPSSFDPPTLEITRQPGLSTDGRRITLSGMVSDDHGVAEVLVFVGQDKVFQEGRRAGASFRSVPFTAEVALAPGANTLSVLARDEDGLTVSRSVVVWSGASPVLAKAPGE